jgi:uncharacterized protein (TIGR02001 family)
MRTSIKGAFALVAALSAAPAFAQDAESAPADPPAAITVSGSVALTSDYRFRGVSQSDEAIAIQGGITITHESGFYVAAWGSNLAGWGTFGGAGIELDLVGGYKHTFGDATVDVGVTYYNYPSGADETDFFEGYAKLSGTAGPATLTATVAYAPNQGALGNFSNTPFSRGQSWDNLYLAGDIAAALPSTPFTLKGHIGYSDGNPGLGPNGTSVAPTGTYWDWSLAADWAITGPLVLTVAYVDTDISRAESAYLLPNFSNTRTGGSIADGTVVATLSAAF